MMKGITILIAVLILVSTLTNTTMAVDLEIGSEFSAKGMGSFDCDLKVQSEKGFTGQKLEETLYTRYLGTGGGSQIEYNSNLEVFLANITGGNRTAEIAYAQTSQTTNAKHHLYSSDYPLGASVGFTSKGDTAKSFELFADPVISEFEIEGSVSGRLKLMRKVVDPTNRTIYLREAIQLDGNYDYAWSPYAEGSGYPAGGCDDYLACP